MSPVDHATRNAVISIWLFCLTAIFSPAAAALTSGVTVTSPAEGTVVRPGQIVHITVSVDTSLVQPRVIEIGAYIKQGFGLVMMPVNISAPPYEADVPIPPDVTGPLHVRIAGWTTSEKAIFGPTITLSVIPDETPASIELKRWFILGLPKNPGDPLPDQEDTRTISVLGHYTNNIERSIRGALFGTTYTSSNPAVATVNANGVVTPVAPGIAFITVEHKGLKAFSKVTVEPLTGPLPPIDQTANVAIQASGFRLDRTKGLYVQQLTVTNQSSLPLPVPLELVLTGLPDGVRLSDDDGVTKVVTPLGSPFKSAQFDEQDFLSPGNSFTLTLEFANDDGAAITYTPKVYTGSHL